MFFSGLLPSSFSSWFWFRWFVEYSSVKKLYLINKSRSCKQNKLRVSKYCDRNWIMQSQIIEIYMVQMCFCVQWVNVSYDGSKTRYCEKKIMFSNEQNENFIIIICLCVMLKGKKSEWVFCMKDDKRQWLIHFIEINNMQVLELHKDKTVEKQK